MTKRLLCFLGGLLVWMVMACSGGGVYPELTRPEPQLFLSADSLSLAVGDSVELDAVVRDVPEGVAIEFVIDSRDPTVAVGYPSGWVKGIRPGSTVVRVTVPGLDLSDSAFVLVQ